VAPTDEEDIVSLPEDLEKLLYASRQMNVPFVLEVTTLERAISTHAINLTGSRSRPG
jgi:hypothetical protein